MKTNRRPGERIFQKVYYHTAVQIHELDSFIRTLPEIDNIPIEAFKLTHRDNIVTRNGSISPYKADKLICG
jgi:D-ribose pyranose/furanose isomerase RbsD